MDDQHDFYVKKNEMSIACSTHEEERNACRILVRESEGKRLVRRLEIGLSIILKWILEK
jgi:hypothetical protein